MKDVLGHLASLQRPGLLVRAARIAARHYRRERHLGPLLDGGELPRHAAALLRLSEIEAEMDALRLTRNAGYSIARHVNVLAALMTEARLMLGVVSTQSDPQSGQRSDAPVRHQAKASASSALRLVTNSSIAAAIAGSSAGC